MLILSEDHCVWLRVRADIYMCVCVATDAAAGIGSDSTERGQLDGIGGYWTEKEKKTGFSFTWDWHRGTKHLSLTMAVCCPSPHLLLSLFKSFSSCWAGLRCQVVLQGSQIVTNGRKDSLRALSHSAIVFSNYPCIMLFIFYHVYFFVILSFTFCKEKLY